MYLCIVKQLKRTMETTIRIRKAPTHRCTTCGKLKYKYEFHVGYAICKECRHAEYMHKRLAQGKVPKVPSMGRFDGPHLHKRICIILTEYLLNEDIISNYLDW